MRDREKIDSELRLIALRRQAIREQGGRPSSREADELLDEILAHGAGAPELDVFDAWETEVSSPGFRGPAKPAPPHLGDVRSPRCAASDFSRRCRCLW